VKAIQATIGILVIIGLSWGIGFGVYRTYDGKNLRDLTGQYVEMRKELEAAQADALTAREELMHYRRYIWGELEMGGPGNGIGGN
jgi:hypothetical protein